MVTSSMWATPTMRLLLGSLQKWWLRWISDWFIWCNIDLYFWDSIYWCFSSILQVYAKVSGEPSLEVPTVDVSSKEFYGEGYDDSDKRIPDMTIINKQLGIALFSLSFLLCSFEVGVKFWHDFCQVGTLRHRSGICLSQPSPINTGHMLRLLSRPLRNQLHLEKGILTWGCGWSARCPILCKEAFDVSKWLIFIYATIFSFIFLGHFRVDSQ